MLLRNNSETLNQSYNALFASGVYFSGVFWMLVSLSVLHIEVVTFLHMQDKPNSFPSPLSPDLDKGMTVVPLHEGLQAV